MHSAIFEKKSLNIRINKALMPPKWVPSRWWFQLSWKMCCQIGFHFPKYIGVKLPKKYVIQNHQTRKSNDLLGKWHPFFKGLLGGKPAFTTRKLAGHWSTFLQGRWLVVGCNPGAQLAKIGCQSSSNWIISTTSWWFQPIWKILAKLDHLPREGWT